MSAPLIWGTLDTYYEGGEVLGRRVANTRFLDTLFRRDPFDEYHFFLDDETTRKQLQTHFQRHYPELTALGKIHYPLRRELPRRLDANQYHCFHQSDPILGPHVARLRNRYSGEIFPITSGIHSLSYAEYATNFLYHLWPGTTVRDCVISTSRAGSAVLERFFALHLAHYNLDPETFRKPKVRRIPLGIDPKVLAPASPEEKTALRQNLRLPKGRTAILAFGRLSPQSKYDLVPLLRAFQFLFGQGMDPDTVCLAVGGWSEENDPYIEILEKFAAHIGLDMRLFTRPDERTKLALFRASDIFVSPSDNPQETFGITVLEAASAGLPAVVSSYDGYRDLVLDNETGFTIPTFGPAETAYVDTLAPLLSHDRYHLLLAQQTVVRVPAMAEALRRLITNPALRAEMGAAARERAINEFSWDSVLDRHLDLWDRLWEYDVDPDPLREVVHPLQIPYADAFSEHPMNILAPGTPLVWSHTGERVYRGSEFPVIYDDLSEIVTSDIARKLLFAARTPVRYSELLEKLPAMLPEYTRDQARILVLWALKQDLLTLA